MILQFEIWISLGIKSINPTYVILTIAIYRDESSMAVCGNVFLHILLACRGSLDTQHQLPPLGGTQDLVRNLREARGEG